jgi:uncharacterized Zn finger protein
MGRRRRFYRDWYPPRTAPIAVEHGMAVRARRGRIGATWWSQRWLQALESFELEGRLARGRNYARRGQVLTIDIECGRVVARVQGSRPTPYKVVIAFHTFTDKEWARIITVLAGKAVFAAKLLAGEMPETIEEAFADAATSLFPTAMHEVETECSCPDWANPCKHIAAVYFVMAEEFDRDPFLLFTLRGRTKTAILDALRVARTSAAPAAPAGKKKSGARAGKTPTAAPPSVAPITAPATPAAPHVTPALLRTFWCARRAYPAIAPTDAAADSTQLLRSLAAPPWHDARLLEQILDACRRVAAYANPEQ